MTTITTTDRQSDGHSCRGLPFRDGLITSPEGARAMKTMDFPLHLLQNKKTFSDSTSTLQKCSDSTWHTNLVGEPQHIPSSVSCTAGTHVYTTVQYYNAFYITVQHCTALKPVYTVQHCADHTAHNILHRNEK